MELVLHLGAHRTGSTAIDIAFRLSREAVKEMGVTLRRPNRLRKIPHFQDVGSLTAAALGGDAAAKEKLDAVAAWLAQDLRQSEKTGRQVMIYSEENILGFMEENLARGTLYHDLPSRLQAYDRVLPAAPARIGIGLRSYDSLWLSTYAYILKFRHLPPFASLRTRIVANRRGWVDVLTEVRAAWPGAELFVWRQEDLAEVFRPVMARLGRIEHPDRLVLPDTMVNASLGPDDLALVHMLRKTEKPLYGDALLARLAAYAGERPPAAPGLTDAERAAMRARYDEDMARIAMMGVEVIRPAMPERAGS